MAGKTVQSRTDVLVLKDGAGNYFGVPKTVLDTLSLTNDQMGDLGTALKGATGPVLGAGGWTLIGLGEALYEAPSGVGVDAPAAAGAGASPGKVIAMFVVRR
ncbi:MAG TPA: hypothetical protein VG266_04370 [Candidatus Dormibacteraeota bacterium]|jgi:hypothetical protein|nr:hypothetical protein [Candidatus Dormibacteraeota bacterium]